jgi:UTP--glucose-1-phosphate uridylyltransferase
VHFVLVGGNTTTMSLRNLSVEYFNLTTEAAEQAVEKQLQRLVETLKDPEQQKQFRAEMEGFKLLFKKYMRRDKINWSKIKPPSKDFIIPMKDLEKCDMAKAKQLVSKICVLKLNGGLGTTMGCVGPKSLIEVRGDQTFLDLTVKQIKYLNDTLNADIPLILMNSFNTDEDTAKILQKYITSNVTIHTFNQSRYPRFFKDTLQLLPSSATSQKEDWYPPGHGDVFHSLYNSGLLKSLMEQGKEYVFVSNIDNLAATVDFDILNYMQSHDIDYIMEVTDKTRADIKGGTLIDYDGHLRLLEIAMVPPDKVEEFKSIKKFKIFNTNNIWLRLSAIQKVVETNALKDIDVIENVKRVKGSAVVQLETAIGAAIQFFPKAIGINVPRTRFLPVKDTSDLFTVRSELYTLKDGSLIMNPNRPLPGAPLVKLGNEFKKVGDFVERIPEIPDILELDQLTISGNVYLGSKITLKGTVIIVAGDGCRIDIPSGAILENKVVTGNLRILDH